MHNNSHSAKWYALNCCAKTAQLNSNTMAIYILFKFHRWKNWVVSESNWFKIFFGGTKCEVKHWVPIIRVPVQKNTHRQLKADTIKCNSGAIKPNSPQRICKSAQSFGQVPNCVTDLKRLALAVGTSASSPDLSCAVLLPILTGFLQVPPHLAQLRHSPEHTESGTANTIGSDCRLVFMSFTLHWKSSPNKWVKLHTPSAWESNNVYSWKN